MPEIHMPDLVPEKVDLIQKQDDGRVGEPLLVNDRLEELEGLRHPVATRVLGQGLVVLGQGSHVEEGGDVAEGVDPFLALAALAAHVDETAHRASVVRAHTQQPAS